MHETWIPRRGTLRTAVAASVVDETSASRAFAQRGGEITPLRDRAEPFVQKDDGRRGIRTGAEPLILDPTAADRQLS
jgi:hypothetical protein